MTEISRKKIMTRRRTVSLFLHQPRKRTSISWGVIKERIEALEEQLERQEEFIASLQSELETSKAMILSLSNVQAQVPTPMQSSSMTVLYIIMELFLINCIIDEDDSAVSSALKSENEALQMANERLNAELEKLNQELAAYEARLGKGDYNPATTKVHPYSR